MKCPMGWREGQGCQDPCWENKISCCHFFNCLSPPMKQTHMDLPLRKCLLLFWPIHHKWPLSSLPQCIPEHSVVKFIQFLKNKKRTEDPAIVYLLGIRLLQIQRLAVRMLWLQSGCCSEVEETTNHRGQAREE
jgi:hypothetical protein